MSIEKREWFEYMGTYMRSRAMSESETVRWQVFQRTVQDARARNAGVPAKEINAAVEDALAAVRAERSRAAG